MAQSHMSFIFFNMEDLQKVLCSQLCRYFKNVLLNHYSIQRIHASFSRWMIVFIYFGSFFIFCFLLSISL